MTAWVGRLLRHQRLGREGHASAVADLRIHADNSGPRVLVQLLPDGCPEEFPLPDERVTSGNLWGIVAGRPEGDPGDRWWVPVRVNNDGTWLEGWFIDRLDWPSKPKPKRYRVSVEVASEEEAQRVAKVLGDAKVEEVEG